MRGISIAVVGLLLAVLSKPVSAMDNDHAVWGITDVNGPHINYDTGLLEFDDDLSTLADTVHRSATVSASTHPDPNQETTGKNNRRVQFVFADICVPDLENNEQHANTYGSQNPAQLANELVSAFNNMGGSAQERVEQMIELVEKHAYVETKKARIATEVLQLFLDTMTGGLERISEAGTFDMINPEYVKKAGLIRFWKDVAECTNESEIEIINAAFEMKGIKEINRKLDDKPMYREIHQTVDDVLRSLDLSIRTKGPTAYASLCDKGSLFAEVHYLISGVGSKLTEESARVEKVKGILLTITLKLVACALRVHRKEYQSAVSKLKTAMLQWK